MEKEDYTFKIHALLKDDPSYKLVLTNPSPTVINQIKQMSGRLRKDTSTGRFESDLTMAFHYGEHRYAACQAVIHSN